MKQAVTITNPPTFDSTEGVETLITREDRIEELTNQSPKVGLLLTAGKRKLLIRIYNLRNEIFEKLFLFDVSHSSNLEDRFRTLIPKSLNRIKKAKNEELAEVVVDLMGPFGILFQFLVENEVGVRLRSDGQKDTVMALSTDMYDLKANLDKRIVEQILQKGSNPLAKWMVKLSDAQKERTFSCDRVPADEKFRNCLVCGNPSINEPTKNEGILQYNANIISDFDKKSKVWIQFTKDREKGKASSTQKAPSYPKDPTDPRKDMKRAPVMGKMRSHIYQCMCLTSKCIMRNSDIGSTCPIKCINPESGQRYEWDDSAGCTCPICKSICSAAYSDSDFGAIATQAGMVKLQEAAGLGKRSQLDETMGIRSLLSGYLGNAAEAAKAQAEQIQRKNMVPPVNSFDPSHLQSIGNVFHETAALNIVKGAGMIPAGIKQKMAETFGTSTIVSLPMAGVPKFDTKSIGRSAKKHSTNNRLLGDGATVTPPVHAGMQSRLQINYQQPQTDEFKDAVSSFALGVAGGARPRPAPQVLQLGSSSDEDGADDDIIVVDKKMKCKEEPPAPKNFDHFSTAWSRMKARNRREMQVKKREVDLTPDELKKRKRAKSIFKSLMKNEQEKNSIIEMIAEPTELQEKYCSQDLVDRYFDCYMSDDEK